MRVKGEGSIGMCGVGIVQGEGGGVGFYEVMVGRKESSNELGIKFDGGVETGKKNGSGLVCEEEAKWNGKCHS